MRAAALAWTIGLGALTYAACSVYDRSLVDGAGGSAGSGGLGGNSSGRGPAGTAQVSSATSTTSGVSAGSAPASTTSGVGTQAGGFGGRGPGGAAGSMTGGSGGTLSSSTTAGAGGMMGSSTTVATTAGAGGMMGSTTTVATTAGAGGMMGSTAVATVATSTGTTSTSTSSSGGGGMGASSSSTGGGPTCNDHVKDGQETDVDCGGLVCPACALGKACVLPADCATGSCVAGACACGTHLLISQVRSRGLGGGSDELVELYNPTSQAVTLDASWRVDARSDSAMTFTKRWQGSGQVLPPHEHLLIGGSAYVQAPAPDGVFTTGITDASSVRLVQSGSPVDVLCYAFDAPTMATLQADPGFGCPGTPANNAPHANDVAGDVDTSLRRKLGTALGGNCVDTGDNASDFASISPAVPLSLASPPAP